MSGGKPIFSLFSWYVLTLNGKDTERGETDTE
jgi:hypothetical protein